MRDWNSQARNREAANLSARPLSPNGKTVAASDIGASWRPCWSRATGSALRATIRSRPISGQGLGGVNPAKVNNLHMVQSVLALPEHLDVFERGIAATLDFSFPGRKEDGSRGS